MATVSPAYLAQLNAGLMSAPPPPQGAPMLPPGVPMPPPGPMDAAPPPPPPAPPGPPAVVEAGDVESWQDAPQPPNAAVPAGYAPAEAGGDGQGPMEPDVRFSPVTTPGAPAREVETRGPTQNALLQASYGPGMEAADNIQLRSAMAAQHEADQYDLQAEHFAKQQEAMERVQQRRQWEMQQLRADYDGTIQKLGEAKLDHGRAWANMSTMDKIGATILVMLGSAAGGAQHGMKILDDRIKEDVEAQKFDYQKGLDVAKAQQTAYGMAIEQYGSEDAAYHAAMASGQLAAAAKVNSLQAQWKGTDAANQADMLRASLMSGAARSAAEGYKYLQPTGGSTKYRMEIRGQQVPGLVSEERAQGYSVEHGVKPAERVDETLVKGGVEASLQERKLRAEAAKEGKKFQVKLPNGETVDAPSAEEATQLRELSVSTSKTQRLVAEAKKIRGDTTFRASPEGRNKLKQIQAELVTQFGVQNKLGALSSADMELAVAGTADLFQWGNGVEARLDRLSQESMQKRVDRVATYPGAPPKSSGQMPGSFKAAK
jgi:hypothetical protein